MLKTKSSSGSKSKCCGKKIVHRQLFEFFFNHSEKQPRVRRILTDRSEDFPIPFVQSKTGQAFRKLSRKLVVIRYVMLISNIPNTEGSVDYQRGVLDCNCNLTEGNFFSFMVIIFAVHISSPIYCSRDSH